MKALDTLRKINLFKQSKIDAHVKQEAICSMKEWARLAVRSIEVVESLEDLISSPQVQFVSGINHRFTFGNMPLEVVFDCNGKPLCAKLIDEVQE